MKEIKEYFLNNIFDEQASYRTKLQQIGEFIKYLNELNIDMNKKIDGVIFVLDKVKAHEDGYLKQLPYTAKTTALVTYLLIEKLVDMGVLSNSADRPFVLCDLTYGYGMQYFWVVELLKKNLLDRTQTFIALKYDRYFSIGDYYKEIEYSEKKKTIRVYFDKNHNLIKHQHVVEEDGQYYIQKNLKLEFSKENNIKKNDSFVKQLADFEEAINYTIFDEFYLIDKSNKVVYKINKQNLKYQKIKKNADSKLINYDTIGSDLILNLSSINQHKINITDLLNKQKKNDIYKLSLDYEDDRIESSIIEYFDFINYDSLNYNGVELQEINNSIYILDLPSNDIVNNESSIADKIINNITSYLSSLPTQKYQTFIISTAKTQNDFKENVYFKGIVKLSGNFMPLTDNSMNLVLLSNANFEKLNIDLSNEMLIEIETNRIFENKKEIKQKIKIKDIIKKDSMQYYFINQLNNKSTNDLFIKIQIKDYIIFNNLLFLKKGEEIMLKGVIKEKKLENSNLILSLETSEQIMIRFNSSPESLVLFEDNIIFKKYIGEKLKDAEYINLSSEDNLEIYRKIIKKLYIETEGKTNA